MAKRGECYFDGSGQVHKTPDAATKADLAVILGRVGEGDSLAPGIATTLFDKRAEIERVFAEHDALTLPGRAE
jgi:hypothetical protein